VKIGDIGRPAELKKVIAAHRAVVEVAVFGMPDPARGGA
jgi:acyl-coenzyme A synthetase/AMP-(fatty) acid ligase